MCYVYRFNKVFDDRLWMVDKQKLVCSLFMV